MDTSWTLESEWKVMTNETQYNINKIQRIWQIDNTKLTKNTLVCKHEYDIQKYLCFRKQNKPFRHEILYVPIYNFIIDYFKTTWYYIQI